MSAINAPETAAATTASVSATAEVTPSRCTAQNPHAAPTSIIPWTPRLRTPARSASSSPSAAYRSGVP